MKIKLLISCKNYKLHKSGFTLLEVLIAITIFSIVIAALYSSFFLSQNAVYALDESLLTLQESRGIIDRMKREIETAFYSNDKTYSSFLIEDRDFYGKQTSRISFTAFSPLKPGLSKISYTVEEEGEKLILKKKIESAYYQDEDKKSIDLMEDMESFTVEAKYDDNWVRTWDSELAKKIPDEVRITVLVKIGDKQKQISISDIARPKIGRIL